MTSCIWLFVMGDFQFQYKHVGNGAVFTSKYWLVFIMSLMKFGKICQRIISHQKICHLDDNGFAKCRHTAKIRLTFFLTERHAFKPNCVLSPHASYAIACEYVRRINFTIFIYSWTRILLISSLCIQCASVIFLVCCLFWDALPSCQHDGYM